MISIHFVVPSLLRVVEKELTIKVNRLRNAEWNRLDVEARCVLDDTRVSEIDNMDDRSERHTTRMSKEENVSKARRDGRRS